MSAQIEIVEVSPRDGLQNEKTPFSTDEKLSLINDCLKAGIRRIEVASFVNPKRVPQMADAEAVIAGLPPRDDTSYIGLVLNLRGAERALNTNIDELGSVVVASDTFGMKNQGKPIRGMIDEAKAITALALREGRRANVMISAAWGCPFEGEVSPRSVIEIAKELADCGTHEMALADTVGVGDPWRVADLVGQIRAALPSLPVRVHFHNTRNTGLANAYAAICAGATTLDASLGGIGGCPFAPRATGNIPTEDLAYQLARGGKQTGVNLETIISAAQRLEQKMGAIPGMLGKSGNFPNPAAA